MAERMEGRLAAGTASVGGEGDTLGVLPSYSLSSLEVRKRGRMSRCSSLRAMFSSSSKMVMMLCMSSRSRAVAATPRVSCACKVMGVMGGARDGDAVTHLSHVDLLGRSFSHKCVHDAGCIPCLPLRVPRCVGGVESLQRQPKLHILGVVLCAAKLHEQRLQAVVMQNSQQ